MLQGQHCRVEVVGTVMVTVLEIKKGVILVNLQPRGTTVNSNCYTETLRILNACLH